MAFDSNLNKIRGRNRLANSIMAAVILLTLAHCGRKTAPKPPELARPMPVGQVDSRVTEEGVWLSWQRPHTYADGTEMNDLAGFRVLRAEAEPGGMARAFAQIATVPVSDREKFRKAKRFRYLDRNAERPAAYFYRVVAFSLDGYYSEPSTSARVEIEAKR